MDFPFGESVVRERRRMVPDPYKPGREVRGAWGADVDVLHLQGAFVASSSSVARSDAVRSEILTTKSLYCQPDADVHPGDRIRRGGALVDGVWTGGSLLYVKERPESDTNPFTGWQPVLEIPLEGSEG